MESVHEDQSRKNVQRTIDSIITLIKYRLWGNVNVDRFRMWKGQFESDDKLQYAVYLAQQLIYYSKKDLLSLISFCVAESIRKFAMPQDGFLSTFTRNEWKALIETTRRKTLVCPLFIDGPAASGYMITRMLRDQGLISEDELCNSYQQLADKLRRRPDIKGIIFVDDMMGSGEQAKKTFKDVINLDGKATSLKRYLEEKYATIPITISIAVTPAQTLNEIETDLGYSVIAGEMLTDRHDVLSPLFWGEKHFANGLQFLLEIQEKHRIPLKGYGANAWSIAFEHGAPDNTSPFYIASPNGWTSLIRQRGEDI